MIPPVYCSTRRAAGFIGLSAALLLVSQCGRAATEGARRSSNPEERCASIEECETSCKSGEAARCYAAGVEYELGDTVDQNYSRAAELYERACNDGAAGGCNNLGVLYEIGLSRDQNEEKAESLYGQACEGGDEYGCDNQRRRQKR